MSASKHSTAYVGVTGITSRREALYALADFHNHPRRIMIGVLASFKTLNGQPHARYSNRYPSISDLGSIFEPNLDGYNLVHYASKRHDDLYDQLILVTERAGRFCHGLQLNMTWPDLDVLKRYKKRHPDKLIILQINRDCFQSADHRPEYLSRLISVYGDEIDGILLDGSGGEGKLLDVGSCREYLSVIRREMPDLQCGVAGGLCADNLRQIESLIASAWPLNIDAESGLRDVDDRLDLDKMRQYLKAAGAIKAYRLRKERNPA